MAGGLDELGGRVELCHRGVWGSICNHGFGEQEAKVVCTQLGFTECKSRNNSNNYHITQNILILIFLAWSVVSIPIFGTGMGPIHLDAVSCEGNESTLLECSHRGLTIHNCYRNEEVAVTCRAGNG